MKELPFTLNLEDKVVVVTGGGGVLCGEFSRALAACGASVAVLDLNLEKAEKVVGEINSRGGKALAVKGDVLDKDSLCRAREEINTELGRCNILINGAGGNHPRGTTDREFLQQDFLKNESEEKTFFDLDKEGVEFVFNLNFLGTFLTSQVFAEKMVENDAPVIVNISSMNAFTPLTKIPAYSAAKAAVSNFTQWLAVYLSRTGIRVNAIAPGFFMTAQNEKLLKNEDGSFTERARKIINNTPQQRFGKPEELIGTLFWLINEKASGFVNGIVVPVDGGFSAYSGV